MFGRSEKIWKQYPQNITAVNNKEALYLLHYLSYVRITKCHLGLTEIIDLQRYRIIRKKQQVHRLLAEKDKLFLFPVNKN
ncbi:hypothetical protein [Taibaiella koreensis]|uniref:hypothetical protein n=1 Tax=Taibaiella koreensis TaxID=1268548 RepID=UPI000E59E78C|nr:hypothetical protein [Taibaiella koreensis]